MCETILQVFSYKKWTLYFSRYKKQIEDAEEIAALNLAKFRKAQQQLEEAEERSKMAELNMARLRGDRVYFVTNSHWKENLTVLKSMYACSFTIH